ncbi:MAG: hypothetical protein ACTHNP_01490 [Solirubrobacterales bacterium]
MVDELNIEPRSLTELSRGPHGLSYHQVSRRANLLAIGGFIQEWPSSGARRPYALTDKARRAMALIVGIGRWRRHAVPKGKTGLDAPEAATALRAVLPLAVLPEHGGKSFGIGVAEEEVWASVGLDGNIRCSASPPPHLDGHARGGVKMWIDTLLDGPPEKLSTDGDGHLIRTCLLRLHATLWTRWARPPIPDSS